jgi:DNA-binding MarR family transcriptional regulator
MTERAEREAAGLLPEDLRVWMRVLAAAGAVEQLITKKVKEEFGVSHDEFLVLCLLADQPDHTLRMSRIAELLGRPKTRLTYQVGCLNHSGLVTRQAVCGDRRGIALKLTEKGTRLLEQRGPILAEAVREALGATIGPDQSAALTALLARGCSAATDQPEDHR